MKSPVLRTSALKCSNSLLNDICVLAVDSGSHSWISVHWKDAGLWVEPGVFQSSPQDRQIRLSGIYKRTEKDGGRALPGLQCMGTPPSNAYCSSMIAPLYLVSTPPITLLPKRILSFFPKNTKFLKAPVVLTGPVLWPFPSPRSSLVILLPMLSPQSFSPLGEK